MLDFHSKEIKSNVLRRFREWIDKSTEGLFIECFIYKIEVGSNLDF